MYDIHSKKYIKTKKKKIKKANCFMFQGNSKIHDVGELQNTVFSFVKVKAKLHILLASLTFLFWIVCKIASIYYSQ